MGVQVLLQVGHTTRETVRGIGYPLRVYAYTLYVWYSVPLTCLSTRVLVLVQCYVGGYSRS